MAEAVGQAGLNVSSARFIISAGSMPIASATFLRSVAVKATRPFTRELSSSLVIDALGASLTTWSFCRAISARTSAATAWFNWVTPFGFKFMSLTVNRFGFTVKPVVVVSACLAAYARAMALKPKPVTALDRACSLLLQELVDRSGLSQQRLATATGISQNRVGIILRGERAASVGEIAKLAECVATTASAVITQAEAQISGSASSASAPGSDVLGVDNVARLDFGRGKSRKVNEDLEELEPFA